MHQKMVTDHEAEQLIDLLEEKLLLLGRVK